ncbi:protein lifeguard 2-like [Argopecten irradians]|uniref:protein lifeguard 2-like n=1 Tax=Argopecten irradians TaxID=31199 RepID=UPI0037203CF1
MAYLSPSAPPPSYEEAVTSGSYIPQTSSVLPGDVPPPYVYNNFVSDDPSTSQGSSAGGTGAGIFVVQPPSAPRQNQTDPIPPKPSTPQPAANRNNNPNSTPVSGSQPNNQRPRVRRDSFSDKNRLRDFFREMYLILAVQMGCALVFGAGMFSNEHIKGHIKNEIPAYRGVAIGLTIPVMFFTWTMGEIRKRNKTVALIFLVIFSLVLTYGIMALSCGSGSLIPLYWVGICCAHSILMQIFLRQEKITFTLVSGMIFTLVTVVILTGISITILGPIPDCPLGGVTALGFCWWVMIFTWVMIDDRKKHGHRPDQAVALQPFFFAGVIYLPLILLAIFFCKFEWKKYK